MTEFFSSDRSVAIIALLLAVSLSVAGASVGEVEDNQSPPPAPHTASSTSNLEVALKCDACTAIATKIGEGFLSAESGLRSGSLTDRQITESADAVCDGDWRGYDTVLEGEILRLGGPGTGRDVTGPNGKDDLDLQWSHRLQDLCDEVLAEVPSDRILYDNWSADHDALEKFLCHGKEFFSACTSEDWGPWPGDEDYDDEDYDDGDFDYTHDEF